MTRRRRIVWSAVALALVAGTLAWLALCSPQPAGVTVRFAGYTNSSTAGNCAVFTVTNHGNPRIFYLMPLFLETASGRPLAVSNRIGPRVVPLSPGVGGTIFTRPISTTGRWRLGVICTGYDWRTKFSFWVNRTGVPLLRRMVPTDWQRPPHFQIYSDWLLTTNAPPASPPPPVPAPE